MSVASVSSRTFRWIALVLCLIACGTAASAQTNCVTTITGQVYSPAGAPVNGGTGDPIPNILVFAYPTTLAHFSTNNGPVSCDYQANGLVPQTGIIGAGTTDAAGKFTFSATNMPASANIVIQAGKWRQQYPNTAITQCVSNTLPPMTMPAQQGTYADLPHIAVVTGSVDGTECIFNQIGIKPSEVTSPAGSGSINLYQGKFSGGRANPDNATNPTPGESVLVSSLPTMEQYDVIMFACQGSPDQTLNTATNQSNILAYTNIGGRVFATHYEYIWLVDSFPTVATFGENFNGPTIQTQVATINTSATFPEGAILAQWIQNVGASYNNTLGQIQLNNVDVNTDPVNTPPAQSWATMNLDGASMQFTFDTPIGQTGVPTVAITYTNNTPVFQPGDSGDSITINVTNNSSTATLPGLTLTVTPPIGLTNPVLKDGGTGAWTCNGLTCTLAGSLAVNASDPVTFTFDILSTAPLGDSTIGSALSGGGLSGTGQCGRVLYNDYHVENQNNVTTSTIYPNLCTGTSGTLTAQEKFLEFSLYNLSNFVSTTTNDIIDIQGLPTLAWGNPLPTISYDTVPYTATLPTATYAGTAVAGTFTYTPVLSTVLPIGTNESVCATFVPTTTANYITPTAPICSTITVVPDTTTTSINSIPTPIFYGQTFTVSAPTVISTGPATLTEGTVTYSITGPLGTTTFCSLTYPTTGNCTLPTLYDAGTYTFKACYHDPVGNFADSCSQPYTVIINPDPTTSAVASSNDPANVGSSVTLTATIGDQYATASGNVQFMDGTTPLGPVLPLTGGATTVTYTTSAFILGPHNITACYAPAIDPSATYDFLPICSANFIQSVVLIPSAPLGTVTLLNSSANPSIVAQAVTFTAAVATTGTFISTPTGTINFFDASSATPTVPLNATPTALNPSGYATFTTSTLTAGTHPITAVYAGSTTYATSTSQPLQQLVTSALTPASTGFLLQVNPTAISVGVGNTASVGVSIAALNNFNQAVQLTCTGMPNGATCTFAQTMIPIGGGKTTLTLSPAAPSACGSGTGDFVVTSGFGTPLSLLTLSALGLFFVRKRKRLVQGLTLAIALCLLPVLNGCSTRCTDFGTQPGVYTVTVTATAMPATSGTSVTQTSTQTIQMNVHL